MNYKHLLTVAIFAIGGGNLYAQFTDGDHVIMNVETGAYLAGGQNWGTMAIVNDMPQRFGLTQISDGIYTLNSYQSNGGDNHFLGTGLYCDAAAANWTFTETSTPGVYTISNGGKYLTSNGKQKQVVLNTEASSASNWRVISMGDIVASQGNATVSSPVDVTAFIKDPQLKRNGNTSGFWTIKSFDGSADPKNFAQGQNDKAADCAESFQSANGFKVTQTIDDLKAGVYALSAQGFYRQDGNDNEHLPYIYVNEEKSTFPLRTGTENSMVDAYSSFLAGNYQMNPVYVSVDQGGSITIGAACENTKTWNIFGQFRLKYYGDVTLAEVLLAEFINSYNEAMSEATALVSADMSADAKTALNDAITNNTIDLNNTTQSELETATANLNAAITPARTSAAIYAQIAILNSKADAFDDAGKAAYAAVLNAYNNKTYSGTVAEAEAILQTAVRSQTTDDADMTAAIVNAGCDTDFTGWTPDAANGNSGMLGASAFEYWGYNNNNTSHFDYYQTITELPTGIYTVSANMYNDQTHPDTEFAPTFGVYASSGNNEKSKAVDVMGTTYHWYTTGEIAVIDGTLRIGVKNLEDALAARWCVTDAFRLTFVRGLNAAEKEELAKADALVAANAVKTAYAGKVGGVFQHTTDAYDAVVAIIDNASATSTEINAAVAAFNNSKVAPVAGHLYAIKLSGSDLYLNPTETTGVKGTNVTSYVTVTSTIQPVKFVATGVNYEIQDVNGNRIQGDNYTLGTSDKVNATSNTAFSAEIQNDGTVMFHATNNSYRNWGWKLCARGTTDGSYVDYRDGNTVNNTWVVEEVSSASMAVNAEAKYGTFCAPFAVEVPSGVTASTASLDGTTIELTSIGATIPANTPVILYAESGLAATNVYGKATAVMNPTSGCLTGVYGEMEAPIGSYVLQMNDGVVGFYHVEDVQPTVGANRAYIPAPAGAKVRAFYFDNNANAIEAISAIANNAIEAIYNANGVKVNALQKGINVVKMQNGKTQKVLVK